MPREAKTISMADFYYVARQRAQVPPVSWRELANELNDRHGVHLKSGVKGRQLKLSHEILRQIYQRMAIDISQETPQSRNAAAAEARSRQETRAQLAARHSEHQGGSSREVQQ